ncbi:MAG: class II fructose-bisphosphate aldolase [Patescibacteria group bacterium]|nr:class II fructose-bisphosphate aldolase [Patescibacteria group bacterium]
MTKSLIQIIKEAEKKRVAVGHFNVANLEMLKAVSHVAERLQLPVIIGTSEGERGFLGIHHSVDLIASYNKEHAKGSGYTLFLNADHTYSLDKVKDAAEVGYDSIIFDGGKLPFEENVQQTKKAVQIAKKINPEIVVEGELGYIGQSSKVLKELPEGAAIRLEDLPTPEQAEQFVRETGVDMLAPAVGNVHGMLSGASNPNLQIERIREIKDAAKVPLVLHGGSGVSDEDFVAAINAGISIIHISTELRVAWRKSFEEALKNNPEEIASYKLTPEVIEKMEKVIENRLRLFNKL